MTSDDLDYKVVIPVAGVGSRLGDRCNHINKALVSIAHKPIICYIIEKFQKDVPIIIILGYKGDSVQEFLKMAYPERRFVFHRVDPEDGPASGLGNALLSVEDHLQCPFIFFTNDAIIEEEVPIPDHNWIGYSLTPAGMDYRAIVLDSWARTGKNDVAKQISEKRVHPENPSYIGVCGISDYKAFWAKMGDKQAKQAGEAYAADQMMQDGHGFSAKKFKWYDTGTIEALEHTDCAFKKKSDPHILQKQDEHIWFCRQRVIKFSVDRDFIAKRIRRGRDLYPYTPQVLSGGVHMYSYHKAEGTILSKKVDIAVFRKFMEFMRTFWGKQTPNTTEFFDRCMTFYKDKTYKRVEEYFQRFGIQDCSKTINGVCVPTAFQLLRAVEWDDMARGVPVRFHGDLHFENVIVTPDDDFVLLDWRQDFGGSMDNGDVYYDLAKILHGIIVSHELINKDHFIVKQNGEIRFDLYRKQSLVACEHYLEKFVKDNEWDWRKVRILTALIYLNIAALHHDPYCHLLFNLGKFLLHEEIYGV